MGAFCRCDSPLGLQSGLGGSDVSKNFLGFRSGVVQQFTLLNLLFRQYWLIGFSVNAFRRRGTCAPSVRNPVPTLSKTTPPEKEKRHAGHFSPHPHSIRPQEARRGKMPHLPERHEIIENIGFFACFPLSIRPAGGPPAPRHSIRFPPAFPCPRSGFHGVQCWLSSRFPPIGARLEAAPPEVPRWLSRMFGAASGGAASCRAVVQGGLQDGRGRPSPQSCAPPLPPPEPARVLANPLARRGKGSFPMIGKLFSNGWKIWSDFSNDWKKFSAVFQ